MAFLLSFSIFCGCISDHNRYTRYYSRCVCVCVWDQMLLLMSLICLSSLQPTPAPPYVNECSCDFTDEVRFDSRSRFKYSFFGESDAAKFIVLHQVTYTNTSQWQKISEFRGKEGAAGKAILSSRPITVVCVAPTCSHISGVRCTSGYGFTFLRWIYAVGYSVISVPHSSPNT